MVSALFGIIFVDRPKSRAKLKVPMGVSALFGVNFV